MWSKTYFIESQIKLVKYNSLLRTTIYCEEMHGVFKTIHVSITEPKPYYSRKSVILQI